MYLFIYVVVISGAFDVIWWGVCCLPSLKIPVDLIHPSSIGLSVRHLPI